MDHIDRKQECPTSQALTGDCLPSGISRREFLRRAGLLGLGTAGTMALLDAAVAPAQTTAKRDLVFAQAGDISKFDPHLSAATNDIRVTFNLFDPLVFRRTDGTLQPALATEWKSIAPTTWQFKLRQGVKWHNGDPFIADDVKFSIERTYMPSPNFRSMVSTYFTTIERIETPDPYTVLCHTKKPDPLLPKRLSAYGGQIVPKKYLEKVGPDTFNADPVGTGPLRFVSWAKDDKTALEANGDYWGGRIDADRITFRPIPETAARVAALLKGEVDLMAPLTPDHLERVERHPGTRSASVLAAWLSVLAVNSKVPPLDNPLVRQALSLAIDREMIVRELWRGRAIAANGPIVKGDAHYDPTLPPLPYDPKEARERLRKANYKGEPIYIESTTGYTPNDKAMSEAVAGMWKDVGVNVIVEMIEYSVRAQKNREKSFKGLWWADPASTVGDPDGMMWRILGPGGVHDYWRNQEWDDLGNAARLSTDERFRGEAYRKMTRIFLENHPWIVVLQPNDDYGIQKYLDWTAHPLAFMEVRTSNLRVRRA
jgi:peptide/nickel transport system substrate-binding protein